VSVNKEHADRSHFSAAGALRVCRREIGNEQLAQDSRGRIAVDSMRVNERVIGGRWLARFLRRTFHRSLLPVLTNDAAAF
jgi:hypothetical protein